MKVITYITLLICSLPCLAKDRSYQTGTYLSSQVMADGTITDTFSCGEPTTAGTVCAGGVQQNGVTVYQIKTDGGIWFIETMRQADDENVRRSLGEQRTHFSAERISLESVKVGSPVQFRVETHKRLMGTETDVFIPFADGSGKETKFVGTFKSMK